MNLSRRSLALSLTAFVAMPKRLFAAEDPFVELGRLVVLARQEMDTPACMNRWRDAEYCAMHRKVSLRGVDGLIRREIEEAIVNYHLAEGYWLEVSKRNAGLASEGSLSLRKLERALLKEYGGAFDHAYAWHTDLGPIESWMVAPFAVPGPLFGGFLIVRAQEYSHPRSISGGGGVQLPLTDEYIECRVCDMRVSA